MQTSAQQWHSVFPHWSIQEIANVLQTTNGDEDATIAQLTMRRMDDATFARILSDEETSAPLSMQSEISGPPPPSYPATHALETSNESLYPHEPENDAPRRASHGRRFRDEKRRPLLD